MKGLLATLLALGWFLATHALIGRWVAERPELRLLSDSFEARKLAHFRAHADDYDLVYVGTSRVFRAFDPAVFEATMTELGRPLRAYNFGLIGLTYLEERFFVDWVLAQRGERLRWLLVEPTEREFLLTPANLFTLRDVNWHTPEGTLDALEANWRSERGLARKLAHTRAHLLLGVHRLCNVGVVAGALARLFAPVAPVAPVAPLAEGFEGRDSLPESERSPSPEVAADRELEPSQPGPFLWEFYAGITALARAAGVEPTYVIPPTSMPLALFKQAADRGDLPNLLYFPLRSFPEILANQAAYFYDAGHMNKRGAALFSRRLAEQFDGYLDQAR